MHRKNEEKCANIVENEFDSLPNNLTNSIIIEDAEEHRETGHGRHRSNNTVLIRRTLQSLSSEDPEKQDGNRTCRGVHSRNEVLMKQSLKLQQRCATQQSSYKSGAVSPPG